MSSSIQALSGECRRVRELLIQLETSVGWDSVKETDEDLSSVVLQHRALDDREYCLTVKIGPGFPGDASAVSYTTDDIPTTNGGGGANHSWYTKFNEFNLGSLYSEFVRQIDTLAPLRKALRDLDTHTWVLDPPPPVQGLNHLYRRIVVSKGPPATVRTLRQALARNHHNYDPDYSLVQNIERVLDLELPPPPMETAADAEENEDFHVDCGICYSFKLGQALPDRACDQNPKCGRLFHEECLLEWIRSSPDYRTSFQTFFGKCPYCDTQISCQMT